jgi:hypothetical protein
MARLSLTLDEATFGALARDARKERARLATHARRLLKATLARKEQAERRHAWVGAYRSDRADARSLIRDFEPGQLAVMGDEDDEV